MDPTAARVIELSRAVVDAYRLAETLEDGWEERLREAVDALASALAELPKEYSR